MHHQSVKASGQSFPIVNFKKKYASSQMSRNSKSCRLEKY